MAGLGDYLRSHREQSGLTLDEIAGLTRISAVQLHALETEQFELLPGGVFNISFARQFARAIGADEDQAASLLKAVSKTAPDLPFSKAMEDRRDPYLPDGPAEKLLALTTSFLRENGGTLTTVGVGILLIVGGLYSYEAWEQQKAADLAEAQRLEQVLAEAEEPQPEPVIQAKLEQRQPAAPIDLHLKIVDTVWIRVIADGKKVLEGTYSSGDLEPILASEAVTMNLGNAGGVQMELNGKEVPPLGPRGHVRTLRVTTSGVEITGGTPPLKPVRQAPRIPTTTASLRWAEMAYTTPVVE